MEPTLSRRTFLGRLATTAVAAASVARVNAEQARGPAVAVTSSGRMFISLNGAVAPRMGPWPETARLAARLGYGGIDSSLATLKTAGLEASQALYRELNIRPTIVGLPMTGQQAYAADEAAFKALLPQLAEDAAFTAAVGCHDMMLVLSPSSPQPKDERRRLVRDRLAIVGEVLQKSNVRLGLEFLGPLCMRMGSCGGGRAGAAAPATPPAPPTPFIWTLPETLVLAKECGPNVGVVLDAWHWHHSGGTVAEILATERSRIVHVHISDARAMPPDEVRDNMRLMPGEGIINLTGFLRALAKIGYDGGVAPEPLGRIPMDMSGEDAAKLAFETTRDVMQKAGVI
jgi:sugar phosphate isomerase/epimerase